MGSSQDYDEQVEHNLSDRRFDLILEKLDRIGDELEKTNRRLDNDENFLRLAQRARDVERVAPGARLRRPGPAGAAGAPPPLGVTSDPATRRSCSLEPRPSARHADVSEEAVPLVADVVS